MSTVPTLTVGGTDQTDFIHRKTLVVKLQSLDFTLVDPADDPVLHDAVSVDVPDWHGRVSTIESYPLRTAGGDDHRWVKVTCTNKVTAESDPAPFGLSDAPDGVTTFPYREFGYVQTLADQTDLATAEHRMTATVYEPGLVPGMTVEVTNDAEGLAATEFIITELTVEWLRDDVAQYQIQASVEGVPPVTLGGLIDDAGCDCGVYECVPPDLHVYVGDDLPMPQFACGIEASNPSGDRVCRSDVDPVPPRTIFLYSTAVYKVQYHVFHGPLVHDLTAALVRVSGGSPIFTFAAGGAGGPHPPIGASDWMEGSPPYTDDWAVYLADFPTTGASGQDSSVVAEVIYVSGPDPRFDTLPACINGDPQSGQRIEDEGFEGDGTTTDFTTAYPYGANTLEVFVNGLDWTAVLTETDPAAGDYGTAYPYPLGATVSVRYRGA
jgi:hypothetical protein